MDSDRSFMRSAQKPPTIEEVQAWSRGFTPVEDTANHFVYHGADDLINAPHVPDTPNPSAQAHGHTDWNVYLEGSSNGQPEPTHKPTDLAYTHRTAAFYAHGQAGPYGNMGVAPEARAQHHHHNYHTVGQKLSHPDFADEPAKASVRTPPTPAMDPYFKDIGTMLRGISPGPDQYENSLCPAHGQQHGDVLGSGSFALPATAAADAKARGSSGQADVRLQQAQLPFPSVKPQAAAHQGGKAVSTGCGNEVAMWQQPPLHPEEAFKGVRPMETAPALPEPSSTWSAPTVFTDMPMPQQASQGKRPCPVTTTADAAYLPTKRPGMSQQPSQTLAALPVMLNHATAAAKPPLPKAQAGKGRQAAAAAPGKENVPPKKPRGKAAKQQAALVVAAEVTEAARVPRPSYPILYEFDINRKFGPCVGLTRLERWERAVKFGLEPPSEVKDLLHRLGPGHERNQVMKDTTLFAV